VTVPEVPTERVGTSGRHGSEHQSRAARHKTAHGEPRKSLLRRSLSAAVTMTLVALTLVLMIAVGGLAFGYRAAIIKSGSMQPTFDVGALIVTKPIPATQFKPGDIVTFHYKQVGNDLVTHRVMEIKRDAGRVNFVTKGDANFAEEQWHVNADTKLGKTQFHINFVGRIVSLVGDKYVRVVALLLGAIALLVVLLRWILRESAEDEDEDDSSEFGGASQEFTKHKN